MIMMMSGGRGGGNNKCNARSSYLRDIDRNAREQSGNCNRPRAGRGEHSGDHIPARLFASTRFHMDQLLASCLLRLEW